MNRSGEGEYRLNGARCRLIDVLEMLSDTGIGKEAHSVVSQGRVESIVTSKPRDRRLLIEEAAGLGKHRKRRRRAQLSSSAPRRTSTGRSTSNARRARLRPLKRQAEAAALHERLALQSDQAQWELPRDEARLRAERRAEAEAAAAAPAVRAEVEAELAEVAGRREAAERALAERSARREEISRRMFARPSARDRVGLRLDQATGWAPGERTGRPVAPSWRPRAQRSGGRPIRAGAHRRARGRLDSFAAIARPTRRELAASRTPGRRGRGWPRSAPSGRPCRGGHRERRRSRSPGPTSAGPSARSRPPGARPPGSGPSSPRSTSSCAARRRLRPGPGPRAPARGQPGYELALAAALGGRLGAVVVADRASGRPSSIGPGSTADGCSSRPRRARPGAGAGGGAGRGLAGGIELADGVVAVDGVPAAPATGPAVGAARLADLVSGPPAVLGLIGRLLADAWVVDSLDQVGDVFTGIAVTRSGRVWNGGSGELRQMASGGRERVLEQRNRRQALIGAAEEAARTEQAALGAGRSSRERLDAALAAREAADRALRDGARGEAEAREHERRAGWLIEQRRAAPEQGEAAVRRAQLEGELAAERRAVDRAEHARAARERRIAILIGQDERDQALGPQAQRLTAVLDRVAAVLGAELARREAELAADRAAGEGVAAELRACATAEAGIQARLREHGETVTAAEVGAQQARDRASEAAAELGALAGRLGLGAEAGEEPIGDDERTALRERIERLARRREQLGPVNPLAAEEYREALERVEELEAQRTDLETALRELRALIRDTDRQISESFEEAFAATARNFEELVGDVFPGGRGRLRLVREDAGPRPVPGAGDPDARAAAADAGAEAEAEAEATVAEGGPDDLMGVEIEVTPAGKSMKRLMLLSGGEKSMTAIAFLFAVFLARPCPFYILDEVEAALDDLNIDRFLALLRRYSSRAQFIVVTHQKRTMEAADWLYGVSMGGDGVSKLVSRRLASVQLELGAGGGAGGGSDGGDAVPPLAAAGAA